MVPAGRAMYAGTQIYTDRFCTFTMSVLLIGHNYEVSMMCRVQQNMFGEREKDKQFPRVSEILMRSIVYSCACAIDYYHRDLTLASENGRTLGKASIEAGTWIQFARKLSH